MALEATDPVPANATRPGFGSSFGQSCRERMIMARNKIVRSISREKFSGFGFFAADDRPCLCPERDEERSTVSWFVFGLWILYRARLIFLSVGNDKELSSRSGSPALR
jgi:hypothetical protein